MRRRREEEPVLGVVRDIRQHPRSVGALAEPERGEVVGLVDHEQVPGEGVPALESLRAGEEVRKDVRLPQEVHRRDDAGSNRPGIRVHPVLALDLGGLLAIEDGELDRELRAQLVAPLELEGGGADDEDAADASSLEQLAEDEPRLDGLAEADVVREQQRDARHLERLQHGVELVGLGQDRALPWGDERYAVAGQAW